MVDQAPTPWDLQRQIKALTNRVDRQDDRMLGFQRDFVTKEALERELRHIVDDLSEAAASSKETTIKLEAAMDKQRERDEERAVAAAKERRNLTLLIAGWLVSLVVAVSSPIIVQALNPGS